MGFTIPPDSVRTSGTFLFGSMPESPGALREETLYQMFARGAIPDRFRHPFQLTIAEGADMITLDVMPDVLGVGTDDDWIRAPMSAPTAQRIADLYNGSLITRKLSDAIWGACDKIVPIPEPWYNVDGGRKMHVTSSFIEHNTAIAKALVGTGFVNVGGTKKDVVLTPQLLANHSRVAIYGWHKLNGQPAIEGNSKVIQGLNAKSHEWTYVDYAQGIRLIGQDCVVNGKPAKFRDVLADSVLSKLVSDEGPSPFYRYRTDYPAGSAAPPKGGGGSVPPKGGGGSVPPKSTPPPSTLPSSQLPPADPSGGGDAAPMIIFATGLALFLFHKG